MTKKIVAYYPNKAYATYLKEFIDRESPAKLAIDYNSIHDFHDALSSNNEEVRNEAKVMLEVVKYARERGVELVFYGFKTFQREKLYEKLFEKKLLHSTLGKAISKILSLGKALEQPYWANRSSKHAAYLKLSWLNDKFFGGNSYHLHESVLKNKINELPDNSLVLANLNYLKRF